MRRLVCAAPAYLAALGQPARPEDLRTHRCLGAEGTEHELWPFTERNPARSRPITVALEPRLVLNSARASIDAAVRGHGVCRAMAYQVVEHLAHGRLVFVERRVDVHSQVRALDVVERHPAERGRLAMIDVGGLQRQPDVVVFELVGGVLELAEAVGVPVVVVAGEVFDGVDATLDVVSLDDRVGAERARAATVGTVEDVVAELLRARGA